MKDTNNDLHFLGDIFANVANDGYKSFENVFNLLYGQKENDFGSKSKSNMETKNR